MRRFCGLLLLVAMLAGCQSHAALPQAAVTVNRERVLRVPPSVAWQAAVATANRHGIIRVNQPESGLLTFIYKDGPRRCYCNFLIRPGTSPETTLLTVDIFDAQNQKLPDAALQLLPELEGRAESLPRGAMP